MNITNPTQVPEIHAELMNILNLIEDNFCTRIRGEGISINNFSDYSTFISDAKKTPSLSRMADESLTLWRRDARKLLGLKGGAEVVIEDLELFLETASAKDKISLNKHVRKMCAVYFTAERILEGYIENYGDEALEPEVFSEKERAKVHEEVALRQLKIQAEGGITF